jgi:hypothetical protein
LDYITIHTSLSPTGRGFLPGFVNYKKGALDSQPPVIFLLGVGMALSGSVSVILTSAFGGFFLRVGMALSGSVSVISNK